MTKVIQIQIIDYPDALQSAIFGLKELFLMANDILLKENYPVQFEVSLLSGHDSNNLHSLEAQPNSVHLLIIPPSLGGEYYLSPPPEMLQYLKQAHTHGTQLCSACAGTFILAKTGMLDGRSATTHWQFAQDFRTAFPQISLKVESLLVNEGDILTAGGLMSWVDLGLEIVAQLTKPHIMRQLGKFLIVDTARREQRYYESFIPKFDHGNSVIIKVQHHLQTHYSDALTIAQLAQIAFMSERTFLRQFTQATGLKPTQYIQRLRVQKACEQLEASSLSFEKIALSVGYEDANSLRKVFTKIIGLSPSAFRARFA